MVNVPFAKVALPKTPVTPMSSSSHPVGSGFEVIVNRTGLLSFMLGATDTTKSPEVAPEGIVTEIDVALHVFTVISAPLSKTRLLPCVDPNPVPVIVTPVPTGPVVADKLDMTGATFEDELRDTLSNVAVYVLLVLPLLTLNPT
jgi:hypothetical protein